IVVTMHADEQHRAKAEAAGAVGFLSKSAPLPTLASAVRAAAAGEVFVEQVGGTTVLEDYQEAVLDPGAAALTARERELLGLLTEGVSSTEELADRLYISQKTVKNHLASIYDKLAISDRAQAAVEAIRLGLGKR
ncbi:MAG: LuxR C-terminal-related transcriptional regulator, partial [Acidimicrobiia bacterium]